MYKNLQFRITPKMTHQMPAVLVEVTRTNIKFSTKFREKIKVMLSL